MGVGLRVLGAGHLGLDLALRDWLHVRLRAWQMATLIGGTSLLTYALNPAAGMIAVASACAFSAAALVDWATFARLRGSWLRRSNGSNVVGAAVDSVLFLALAPFPFSWAIAAQMMAAPIFVADATTQIVRMSGSPPVVL